MAEKSIQIEIKRFPLKVKLDDLSEQEVSALATQVEEKMNSLMQEEGEIDTLKQALKAALFFAKQNYLQEKRVQQAQKNAEEKTKKLISRLQQSLEEKDD